MKNTVRAYLAKDEYGRYLIPVNKQRPLFLIGPPGIGKTEIMAQAADELGIGLLSYSMTHHTRQSAIGLPIIKQKSCGGEEYQATEYTMSEIISSVYDMAEKNGAVNGILFLDEINCVSETLTPVMLQFLQYKVFGGHRLPDGWIVAAAGNPPEFNSSVREFDIVTMDRLKQIDIEPDINVWKEFAYSSGVHGAVMSYLEIKPKNFYRIGSTVSGKSFVTARGWDDLGRIIGVYEKLGIEADGELISQYIRDKEIAEDFALYYELYKKYRSDYRIADILDGHADDEIIQRAKNAGFDERYTLIGLLLEYVNAQANSVRLADMRLTGIKEILERVKAENDKGTDAAKALKAQIDLLIQQNRKRRMANELLTDGEDEQTVSTLKGYLTKAENDGFDGIVQAFEGDADLLAKEIRLTAAHMNNMFRFANEAFGSAQEMLIIVTELAASPVTAAFISSYGCTEYYKYDKQLMFHERRLGILSEIESLEAAE